MEFFYTFGPMVVGMFAAASIAIYCWKRVRVASLIILIWFAVSVIVSQFSFFPESTSSELEGLIRFVAFGSLAFGPAAVLIYLALRVKRFNSALEKIPTSAFVLTQSYRIGGVFLILAFLRGDLPAEIGLVSGVMDVTVAATAVALAFGLKKNKAISPRLIIVWATFSLLDFSWATIVKFLTFFGPLELSTSASMLGNPPLAIISLFALPLGIFVSVFVIIRSKEDLSKIKRQ
jgi:uncharacterized membrane-anchored protein